jgi:P4 family phage/plasmid primase-like protien
VRSVAGAWDPEVIDQAIPQLPEPLRTDRNGSAGDQPPVELGPEALKVWRGERPKLKDDGRLDRSGTLVKIGRELYDAHANRSVIVAALRERDTALGYQKYTDRADAEERYHEIVDELERNGRNGRARLTVGDPQPPRFNLTDLGNAERFVAHHGEAVRYCYPWRKWLVWTGARWERDEAGRVYRLAKETVRSIYREASDEEDEARRKALAKHARASESETRIRAMVELAKPEIPVSPSELDADPWLLNCENGTIDLRAGELSEHRREDLITKLIPTTHDQEATAPTFEVFLERILPSEPVRRFVQRAVGYAATGIVSEEILPILHGVGANGKSTLINACMEALGDYAIQAAPDLLLAKRGSHPTELADLFGARFVASVEVDEGRRLAESLVKQLTGRDPIKARRMREDFWQFDPTHTVFLATNHRPEVRGTDHAIWRRIRLVPFTVTIPRAEQDKALPEKLRAELPGILRWIVEGCLAWQREGLGDPDEVAAATGQYREDMDILAAFIADRCVVHPSTSAGATPLYNAYKEWCEEHGETKEKQTKFGLRLRERGFRDDRDSKTRRKIWRGIGLFNNEDPPSGGAKQSETVKQFETENQHKQEISTPRERNAEKGFRTVSEASTVSDSNERLTDKEVAEIKELKRQGMAGAIARDEVLRNRGGSGAPTEWFKGSKP